MGFFSLSLVNSSHNYDVSQLELQVIHQKSAEVESFFQQIESVLEFRVSYEEFLEIELVQQAFLLEALLKENDAFESVAFVRLNGDETAHRSRSSKETNLLSDEKEHYLQMTLEGGFYRGPVVSTAFGLRMVLASPVRNRVGRIIQIIAAEISLAPLQKIIAQTELGQFGFSYVVDQNGVILAHSRLDLAEPGKELSLTPRLREIAAGYTFRGSENSDRYRSPFLDTPVVGAGTFRGFMLWS
jgi:methyl-accepting chemotaxis protein